MLMVIWVGMVMGLTCHRDKRSSLAGLASVGREASTLCQEGGPANGMKDCVCWRSSFVGQDGDDVVMMESDGDDDGDLACNGDDDDDGDL